MSKIINWNHYHMDNGNITSQWATLNEWLIIFQLNLNQYPNLYCYSVIDKVLMFLIRLYVINGVPLIANVCSKKLGVEALTLNWPLGHIWFLPLMQTNYNISLQNDLIEQKFGANLSLGGDMLIVGDWYLASYQLIKWLLWWNSQRRLGFSFIILLKIYL